MSARDLFVDGAWTPARGTDITPVIDSFTEEVFGNYRVASVSDVDVAVDAARRAPVLVRHEIGSAQSSIQLPPAYFASTPKRQVR